MGLVLNIPDLATLLTREGLWEHAGAEVDLILEARQIYLKHETTLAVLRKGKGRENVQVPDAVGRDLILGARQLEAAITGLRTERPGKPSIPKHMIQQLESIAVSFRTLADGENDGYGCDLDRVHQRFVLAFTNGVRWVRESRA